MEALRNAYTTLSDVMVDEVGACAACQQSRHIPLPHSHTHVIAPTLQRLFAQNVAQSDGRCRAVRRYAQGPRHHEVCRGLTHVLSWSADCCRKRKLSACGLPS